MRSFTPARPIKRMAFDVHKKRDPSRVTDTEIIAILQQWLGALRAGGDKDIDGSLRRICASHAAAKALPIKTRPVRASLSKGGGHEIAAVYESVTQSIIAELEQGAAPWVKPWKGGGRVGIMPANAATGASLSGHQHPDPVACGRHPRLPHHAWLTFKQALDKGAHVRKGEKGTQIVFTKQLTVKNDDAEDEERHISMLRAFTVFNVAQVDGLDVPDAAPGQSPPPAGAADAFAAATGADIRHGGDRACFVPSMDFIALPDPETFETDRALPSDQAA